MGIFFFNSIPRTQNFLPIVFEEDSSNLTTLAFLGSTIEPEDEMNYYLTSSVESFLLVSAWPNTGNYILHSQP